MITLKVIIWVSFIDLFLLLLGKVLELTMYFIRFLMNNKLTTMYLINPLVNEDWWLWTINQTFFSTRNLTMWHSTIVATCHPYFIKSMYTYIMHTCLHIYMCIICTYSSSNPHPFHIRRFNMLTVESHKFLITWRDKFRI